MRLSALLKEAEKILRSQPHLAAQINQPCGVRIEIDCPSTDKPSVAVQVQFKHLKSDK